MNLTTTQKRTIKQLKDKERRFKKMAKPRKRVAIASEVLSQLGVNRIEPTTQTHASVDSWKNGRPKTGSHLMTEIIKAKKLSADAIGALFVGTALRDSNMTVSHTTSGTSLVSENQMTKTVKRYFSLSQIALIRGAFRVSSNPWLKDAAKFGKKFSSRKDRLKAIMSNIVDNNGTFQPNSAS